MQPGRSLVFIYNADSEMLPKANDFMSRPTGGLTEPCNLIALTFSPIGMKKEWKRFINSLKIEVRFLSRDEFTSEFKNIAVTFPAAFLSTGKDLFVMATTDEINRCRDLEDLIGLIRQRLPQA